MWSKYNYYDYEQAYYKCQWYKCREIALYLLPLLKNKTANALFNKLKKEKEYKWDLPKKDLDRLYKLYFEIKVWLMVYQNDFN